MATPFQTEAWTEYGIGALVLMLRYFARWKTVGIKNWQGDDYFALLSLVFWTAELVMLELIGQNGTNIGITNEIGATLTDKEIAKMEFGSKCLLAGWNFYVTLIWCLKGTMLCFYDRMTLGLKYQKTVRYTQIACVLAYIGVIAVIWGHCTPVHKNWQVRPYPGDQCTLAVANYLTLVVLNLCTDFVIVCIPVPLLWKVKLTLKRKLIIGVLLCSGVFIMIATLLRCILSLKDISGINTSTIWAIRETFVGIIAVNAAAIKPLFSASRWIGSSKGSSGNYKSSGYGSNKYGLPLGTIGGTGAGPSAASSNRHRKMMTDLGDNSSEEHIVQKADYSKKPADFNAYQNDIRAGSTNSDRSGHQNGIMVTREYEVSPAKSTLDV
ncbi:hypothetical protein EDB81DRAFT_939765 [Dactylonectria macrodidyma]|uniref:Rhodopsin domain-containing protein n=1 Tax=Dactylonectria macrodidyma TaxID=307937 RepID=A0A9P9JI73_9HYPO|nr:hypothetical protein EDB81DRAFT_939765 [Dactylonectria macrodidyma]